MVLCYKSEGCWFDPSWCQWIFHWHKILPIALWPLIDSKRVPGLFTESKGGRCVRLTTLPTCCVVLTKSANLKFLEPSGPLRACNGTDLPITGLCVRVCVGQRQISGNCNRSWKCCQNFGNDYVKRGVKVTRILSLFPYTRHGNYKQRMTTVSI